MGTQGRGRQPCLMERRKQHQLRVLVSVCHLFSQMGKGCLLPAVPSHSWTLSIRAVIIRWVRNVTVYDQFPIKHSLPLFKVELMQSLMNHCFLTNNKYTTEMNFRGSETLPEFELNLANSPRWNNAEKKNKMSKHFILVFQNVVFHSRTAKTLPKTFKTKLFSCPF